MRVKALKLSKFAINVCPPISLKPRSSPALTFHSHSLEKKQIANKDHENQLGNLSSDVESIFSFFSPKIRKMETSSFLCFVQGGKAERCFCAQKRWRKKNAFWALFRLSPPSPSGPLVPLSPPNPVKGFVCIPPLRRCIVWRKCSRLHPIQSNPIQSNMFPEPISYPLSVSFSFGGIEKNGGRTNMLENIC